MAEDNKPASPAYVSYSSFKNSIRGFVHDGEIPSHIDPSILGSLSGSVRAQFLSALRFFKLIDGEGRPSADLKALALASEPEWKKIVARLLQSHYKGQLEALRTGTPATLKTSFGSDQAIVIPAARFLIAAALDSDIPVSPTIKKAGIPAPKRKRRSHDDDAEVGEVSTDRVVEAPQSITQALIGKFPDFDPGWPAEQQKAWFDTYKLILAATGVAKPEGGGNP